MHVCIVGGGVIGLCVAWYAAERGYRVTLIERGQPGGDNCSQGNAGMVVPSHFVPLAAPGMVAYGLSQLPNPESPFWIRPRLSLDLLDWGWKFFRAANAAQVARAAPLLRDLNNASRAQFEALADDFGNEFGLEKRGLLMLTRTAHALDEERALAQKARALGIAAEVLTPEETARLDPAATLDIAGSVYFPNDCHLTPGKFTAGLTRRLHARGVRFVWDASVHHFETNLDGRVEAAVVTRASDPAIVLPKGEAFFEADRFVLAGGAWTSELAGRLGLALPMQAGKGYSLTLPRPRQLPTICSILTEDRVAVTPMGATLRVGGTMEIAGNDLSVNPRRVEGIVHAFTRYYPAFETSDFAAVRPWAGLRPVTPDGLPYLGKTARFSNLWIATGHAMMGLSLGPITGKLLAQSLVGEAPSVDLDLLSPDRYA